MGLNALPRTLIIFWEYHLHSLRWVTCVSHRQLHFKETSPTEASRRPRNLRPASSSEAHRLLRNPSRKIGEHVNFPKAGEMANIPESLFLNLWVPANATDKSSLPVKVWIYGGGEED